jgi:hypothetical protein
VTILHADVQAQQVQVTFSLKLIVQELTSYQPRSGDPREGVFRTLAAALADVLPVDSEANPKLAIGIGVKRDFPFTAASDDVRAWTAEVFPILQSVARHGLDCIERHNGEVDDILRAQDAAMARAEQLNAELGGIRTGPR